MKGQLRHIQEKIQRGITEKIHHNQLDELIISDGIATSDERMAVYQNSYWGGAIHCLEAQFPVSSSLLGSDIFKLFARNYLQQHPSKSYTLNNLGQHLATFFIENRPDKQMNEKELWIDFIIEVMQFEWMTSLAFDAPEKPAINIDDAWACNGNIHLYSHRFLTYALCYAVLNDLNAPAIAPEQPNHGCVVRHKYTLKQIPLSPSEYNVMYTLLTTQKMPSNPTILDRLIELGLLIKRE